MSGAPHSRSARTLPSAEELSRRMSRLRELRLKRYLKFKSTTRYKVLNLITILCCVLHWELLLCFAGPAHYSIEKPKLVEAKYGAQGNEKAQRFLREVVLVTPSGFVNKVAVQDYVGADRPEFGQLRIGKDFLLGKWLKIKLDTSEGEYYLRSSFSMIFLCVFLVFVTGVAYFFNFNERPFILPGLAIVNALAVIFYLFL
ncbi:MAG TPA: hypothetical protein PLQ93_06600 [Bacteroidia bacterium]|nr:hypothetical protein [Bacteroidia bacterium]